MTARLEFNEATGILYVIHTDTVGTEARRKVLRDVVELVQARGVEKILVDATDMDCIMSMLDLHLFGKLVAAKSQLARVKTALVCRSSDVGNNYVALVAQNRGAKIEVFHNLDAAESWLAEQ